MQTENEIKEMVKQKYSEIALQDKEENASSCCGGTCSSGEVYNIMTDSYETVEGYNPEADLGLGCGLPTEYAKIKEGDLVVDLGSGAGNDCFVARHEVGSTGKVIGIDFSEAMLSKARANADKRGFNNVEFRQGDIEHMPIAAETADVIVSNCVLNLVPNKAGVVKDIYRVLKEGGHFSISDIVLSGEISDALRTQAELYAGCVTGAIQKEEYLHIIKEAGFRNIQVQKEKRIDIPRDILEKYVGKKDVDAFIKGDIGVYSVSVYAEKGEKVIETPTSDEKACCGPDCC